MEQVHFGICELGQLNYNQITKIVFGLQNVGHFVHSSMCESIFVTSRERYTSEL